MGTSWSDCFIDPTVLPDNGYGFVQLIFLLVIYSCILFYSATILTEGSELLLLIPAYAGVVGSIVLPGRPSPLLKFPQLSSGPSSYFPALPPLPPKPLTARWLYDSVPPGLDTQSVSSINLCPLPQHQ